MVIEGVRKGYHCAWQIYYHIVFPVKYRIALIDRDVTCIIKETATGISERYAIAMEAIGCDKDHIHLLCSAHPKMAPGSHRSDIQEYHRPRDISLEAISEEGFMGR